MITTLNQIAKSLNITKQAVAKYVNRGLLVRNENNKIDLDNPVNYAFLESKGADFGVFGIEMIQKAIKTPLKPDKTEQNSFESETISHNPIKSAGNIAQKLDLQVKLQTLKAKQAETELKTIKIEEQRGKLIDKSLVERYISDTMGAVAQSFISIPFSLIDNIFSIVASESDRKREEIIAILQEKYTKEAAKAVERGKARFKKSLEDELKEAERYEKEQGNQSRD